MADLTEGEVLADVDLLDVDAATNKLAALYEARNIKVGRSGDSGAGCRSEERSEFLFRADAHSKSLCILPPPPLFVSKHTTIRCRKWRLLHVPARSAGTRRTRSTRICPASAKCAG